MIISKRSPHRFLSDLGSRPYGSIRMYRKHSFTARNELTLLPKYEIISFIVAGVAFLVLPPAPRRHLPPRQSAATKLPINNKYTDENNQIKHLVRRLRFGMMIVQFVIKKFSVIAVEVVGIYIITLQCLKCEKSTISWNGPQFPYVAHLPISTILITNVARD